MGNKVPWALVLTLSFFLAGCTTVQSMAVNTAVKSALVHMETLPPVNLALPETNRIVVGACYYHVPMIMSVVERIENGGKRKAQKGQFSSVVQEDAQALVSEFTNKMTQAGFTVTNDTVSADRCDMDGITAGTVAILIKFTVRSGVFGADKVAAASFIKAPGGLPVQFELDKQLSGKDKAEISSIAANLALSADAIIKEAQKGATRSVATTLER